MSVLVKCEICGKISNKSYLASHKRLAHSKRVTVPANADLVDLIASLFARLPEERKREVRARLLTVSSAPG